ncbi:MAG: hypothetical protein WCP21_14870, partial [Armatimonadota bacterium]
MPRALLFTFGLLLAVTSLALAAETTLYVSPTGNDRNAGTLAAPVATVTAARDAVRARRAAGKQEH